MYRIELHYTLFFFHKIKLVNSKQTKIRISLYCWICTKASIFDFFCLKLALNVCLFVSGEFLASRRRYKEAANMYEKAAELRPEDHELAVAAATAMRQAVRYQDAERWYRKAVSIKPTVSKKRKHYQKYFKISNISLSNWSRF